MMESAAGLEELLTEATSQLQKVADVGSLEQWRIRYLGSHGLIKSEMQQLKNLPPDEKPAFGKRANEIKGELTSAFQRRKSELAAGGPARKVSYDMTLPGTPVAIGHKHVITQTIEEISEIFARMGFTVAYGPEVEDEWHIFDALNMPPAHPARDPLESFYITEKVILRSETSNVQIRVMESQPPPVRIISPGRVYRPDTVDATHSFMFHQVEGLYVDEGVSMADLKTHLDQFCKAYFGSDVATRFRPHFFPFTEPSAEVDISCHICAGDREDCPVCKGSGWVELGGCGMVDPNVLEAVGYDTEKYTGYAFGFGIERMVMRKYNIPDIRLLFENDVRFLRQF
ncbi:MAG: phenylalanine--tRNA ligase subunit alpha [Planctomycetota bacterium]|nr:phenylalanine--tRNA ligase subunit alpha [Planctomycetota bacterium]